MGRMQKSQRLLSWLVVMSLTFSFLNLLDGVGGSDDWSSLCPPGCKCTWVSGKKTGDCRASHWSQIPPGLSPDVQVLEMSGSVLKSLPKDAFKAVDLVNVQKVLLKSCGIERIDREAFGDLEIMIELDLTGNRLVSLDMETFSSNIRLRELKLRGNPLSMLTGTQFPPLNYLKLLDMSDCQLSTLPKRAFEMLGVLETLSLAGNRFIRLNEEIFRPLSKLKSLSLDRNPWKCDCRLKSFRDWLVERNLFTHDTKCTSPAHVANLAWDALLSDNFACRPEIESVRINGKPTEAFLVHTDIGSDIRLECLVRGNPPPELKWVRDGTVLSNNSRSYGKSYFIHIGEGSEGEGGRAVWVNLTIPRTEAGDAGEYTCVGSNDGGFAEKNLTLNFQDVPSGAGVGLGLGSIGGGGSNDSGWVVIAVTILTVLIGATFAVILVVCVCSRRRRIKTTATSSAVKSEVKQNGSKGSVGGGTVAVAKLSSPNGRKSCLTMPPGQSIYANSSRGPNSSNSKCTSSSPTSSMSCGPGGVEVTYRMNPLHSSPQVTTASPSSSSLDHNNRLSSINRRQPKRCTFILPGDSPSSPTPPPPPPPTTLVDFQQSHEMMDMNEAYNFPSSSSSSVVVNRNPLHDPNHVLILPPPDEYGSFDIPSCCSSSLMHQHQQMSVDGSSPVCPYPPPPPPPCQSQHFHGEEWASSPGGNRFIANDNLVVSLTQQSPSMGGSQGSNMCATGQHQHQQHFSGSTSCFTGVNGGGGGGGRMGIVPVHSFCPNPNASSGGGGGGGGVSFHRDPSSSCEGIMTKETQTEEKSGATAGGGAS